MDVFIYNFKTQFLMKSLNLLHVLGHVIPTPLEVDIIAFLQDQMRESFNLSLYQVQPGLDIATWPDNEIGPIFGFNQPHLLPYISDPTGKIQGSFIFHDKKLIYQPRSPRLEEMRDSYLWAFSPDKYYSPIGAIDLVKGFLKAGYSLFQYKPVDRLAATFVYAPNGVFNLKKQNLSRTSLEDLAL
jgi:hypothetical protein